ncbi:MAG: hypothetical protein M1376_02000 [Planctomycetes bacterium]|nr:hypothetical protein [Planctomycetota bacterium]
MGRGLSLVLVISLSLCGCAKKDAGRTTETAQAPPDAPVAPAESNVPVEPAKPEHPIVATTRQFFTALAKGNYSRALALSVPGEFTEQQLKGMNAAFQWDQATFAQAWLGTEQSAVITAPVPNKQGSGSVAWAINLVPAQDGRWLVRLADWLPNQAMLEGYLAAFHEVAPDAKSVEP